MRIVVTIEPRSERGVMKAQTTNEAGFLVGPSVRMTGGDQCLFELPDGYQLHLSAEAEIIKFERNS